MQVMYERCCALDVHKKTVVACIFITLLDGSVQRTVRTFSTMTVGLLALADWLESLDMTVVAMERARNWTSDQFFIGPEEGRTIIFVNAQHMRIRARKED